MNKIQFFLLKKKNNEENMVNHLVASLNAIVIEGFIYRFDKVFNAALSVLSSNLFRIIGAPEFTLAL